MADSKAVNRVKRFILYGSELPLCRCETILNVVKEKLSRNDCPTLLKFLENGEGMRALNQLKNVVKSSPVPSDPARCGYNKAAACLSLVLLIRSPATKPTVKAEAYACLDLVCPTSDDLFLFHYYFCRSINDATSLDAAAASGDGGDAAAGVDEGGTPVKRKKGNCTGGMRRALSRWYNSRDPLRLAVDATGIVNRYGQSHAELLKFYHPKPGSKALEIVFSCIGVRGRPHGRDKNKSLTEIVAAYEKTSNGLLEDEKARQVLAHYKKLAHLHRLVKNDVKMTDAARKKWATGEEAATAAGILADMQVPILGGIPNEFWHCPAVLEALIPQMTVRQILAQLPRLSVCNLVSARPSDKVDPLRVVVDRAKLSEEKIHPFEIVAAMRRFEIGHYREFKLKHAAGDANHPKGATDKPARPRKVNTEKWNVSQDVIVACCQAYDIALELLPPIPAGKKILIAIDVAPDNKEKPVSGGLAGMNAEDVIAVMTSIVKSKCDGGGGGGGGAAAAAAAVNDDDSCHVVAFSRTDTPAAADEVFELESAFPRVDVKPGSTPTQIIAQMDPILKGPVDIARLLDHCVDRELRYDVFLILAGAYATVNPPKAKAKVKNALARYRSAMAVEKAKMVVVGTASKMFSAADADDDDSLDVLGFGVSCANRIHDFFLDDAE